MQNYATDSIAHYLSRPVTILVAGADFPNLNAQQFDVQYFEPSIEPLHQALNRLRPDILLADAAQIDAGFSAHLEQSLNTGLPILLRTRTEDLDMVGHLLDQNILPIDPMISLTDLSEIIQKIAENQSVAAHEQSSGLFNGDKIAALKRDAERVAAALDELSAHRPQMHKLPIDANRIRTHIRARRLRERFWPTAMLADPAWDMLLDLAAARLEGSKVSVSSLCIASNVPTTTALRWIKTLSDNGTFVRASDPHDARRAFISLSEHSAMTMEACLEAVLNLPGQ